MAGELDRPFKIHRTPATLYTREVGFAVKVSAAADWIPNRLPAKGTPYRDCEHISKHRLADFGAYILTDIQGDGDYWWFFYSKNKSTAEAWTPFKTPKSEMRNHHWPLELVRIDIVRHKLPIVANTGRNIRSTFKYDGIPVYRERPDTGSLFTLTEYLMPTEPDSQQDATPHPEPISFQLPNNKPFSFPPSLHGPIQIDAMREEYEVYDVAGAAATGAASFVGPFSFPATNFRTCLPFTLYIVPERTSTGSYHVRKMEVSPPSTSRLRRGF
jgi:hypothetical protein